MSAPPETSSVARDEADSYYGRPILKEPVWKPEVPWYFFAGGLSGASAALALGARRAGNDALARNASYAAFASIAASPPLLIADLGRPERFLNMLRVFKVTSPLNVGTWILSLDGAATTVATASRALGRFPRLGRAAEALSALLGLPLSTYTAVLVSNTAVPAWHEARRELPFVFAGSAAASAGGAAAVLTPPAHAAPARRLALAGAALETVAERAMEKRLGFLAEPYHQGEAGRYARLARASTLSGAALIMAAGRRRSGAVAGGALLMAGSLLERFAVFKAGFQSARDPKYTVVAQRQRIEEREGR